jgi:hypothetical protein
MNEKLEKVHPNVKITARKEKIQPRFDELLKAKKSNTKIEKLDSLTSLQQLSVPLLRLAKCESNFFTGSAFTPTPPTPGTFSHRKHPKLSTFSTARSKDEWRTSEQKKEDDIIEDIIIKHPELRNLMEEIDTILGRFKAEKETHRKFMQERKNTTREANSILLGRDIDSTTVKQLLKEQTTLPKARTLVSSRSRSGEKNPFLQYIEEKEKEPKKEILASQSYFSKWEGKWYLDVNLWDKQKRGNYSFKDEELTQLFRSINDKCTTFKTTSFYCILVKQMENFKETRKEEKIKLQQKSSTIIPLLL